MFVTKRKLKVEIEMLQKKVQRLEHDRRRSALIQTADLPKCKSVACYNCKYCSFIYNPGNGALYLLGCGRDLKCKDFVFTDKNKPPVWERANALLSAAGKALECEEGYLPGSVLVAPQPPCHVE